MQNSLGTTTYSGIKKKKKKKKKGKYPFIRNAEDFCFFLGMATLTLLFVEPNIYTKITLKSPIGTFFHGEVIKEVTQKQKPAKKPAKLTPQTRRAYLARKLVFPIKEIPTHRSHLYITAKTGECRPLGLCRKLGVVNSKRRPKGTRNHDGYDYGVRHILEKRKKATIISPYDAEIIELRPDAGSGGYIALKYVYQGRTYKMRLVHLDREPLRRLKVRQKVKAGDYLTTLSTAWPGSSAAHLHLEIYVWANGRWHLILTPHQFF
ncbi:MAG: M23 family metallopeptidase [Moorea sp. SIO4G2]|nr:M23 family metallopeptidase [Moorena sp. SIO4G2]